MTKKDCLNDWLRRVIFLVDVFVKLQLTYAVVNKNYDSNV